MVMPILLCGKSGTGKDYLLNELLKDKVNNFGKLITYTTRPPREGEIDGVNYHFLSKEEFINKKNKNEFYEFNILESNNHYYGTSISSIDNAINEDQPKVIIIEPEGANRILDGYYDQVFVAYIDVDNETLKNRLLNRHKDNEDVANERYYKEIEENWKDKLTRVDIVLDGNQNVEELKEKLLEKYNFVLSNGIQKNKKKSCKIP